MNLKKFKESNNKKVEIILFTITCILLISGVLLYRTFAIFETNDTFNVIDGSIEDVGDIYFAFYKNGVIQKEMPRKEEGYVLDENQSYCGVLGSRNPDIKVSMTDDETIKINGVTTSRTKCNLYFVKGAYILGKGVPIVTEGNGLYEVTHENLSGTVNDEGFKTTEYRYAGNSPDNYITFNNELWRIIGLVNVMTSENTVVQRVKIVRNDSIGEYSWDSSDENVNDGLGVNEWSESDIMKLLNPGFEKESFNNSLYWNGQSGNCYTDRYNVFSSCSFSNNLNKSQNYIEDVFWNTGSNEGKYNYNEINVYQFYEIERSNRIPNYCKQHGIGNACNDNVSRTYLWKGKVGLIYPSDFGYATIGNETTTRLTCQQTNMHDWNNFQDCSNNNWLNLSEKQWTITPCSTEEFSLVDAFSIRDFIVREDWIRGSMGIRPVVFLKTNTFIKTGNGSIDHSYELSLVY